MVTDVWWKEVDGGSMQSHLDRMVISHSGADFSTTSATAEALLRVTSENIYMNLRTEHYSLESAGLISHICAERFEMCIRLVFLKNF